MQVDHKNRLCTHIHCEFLSIVRALRLVTVSPSSTLILTDLWFGCDDCVEALAQVLKARVKVTRVHLHVIDRRKDHAQPVV